jgi:hypothetical protein
MSRRAFITGIAATELSSVEREFIRAERPWGGTALGFYSLQAKHR